MISEPLYVVTLLKNFSYIWTTEKEINSHCIYIYNVYRAWTTENIIAHLIQNVCEFTTVNTVARRLFCISRNFHQLLISWGDREVISGLPRKPSLSGNSPLKITQRKGTLQMQKKKGSFLSETNRRKVWLKRLKCNCLHLQNLQQGKEAVSSHCWSHCTGGIASGKASSN